jgi:threonine/homoserine/homoserine lactone efflux protein
MWEEMPDGRKAYEILIAPAGWGLLCGLALGVSEPLYLVGAVIGILGGIVGGMQHSTSSQALLRGLWAGLLFGLAILLGFEIGGEAEPEADIPDPRIFLLLLTTVPALPLHWLGWKLRARSDAKLSTAGPDQPA